MLALPTSTPVVPASANLPFLFRLDEEGVLESKEWEGVRDFIPSGRPSLGGSEEVAFANPDGFCFQKSPLSVCDVCEDAALSWLVVLDKDAISAGAPNCRVTGATEPFSWDRIVFTYCEMRNISRRTESEPSEVGDLQLLREKCNSRGEATLSSTREKLPPEIKRNCPPVKYTAKCRTNLSIQRFLEIEQY